MNGGRSCLQQGLGPDTQTEVCRVRNCQTCEQIADVGFIVDSSASIDNQEYQDQKSSVKNLIECLHQSGDGFQTGLIQFSADAELIYKLNDAKALSTLPLITWEGPQALPELIKL